MRIVNVFHRILSRSGELSFDKEVDLCPSSEPYPAHIMMAVNMSGPVSGKSFIDVGCWTGGLLRALSQEGAGSLVGVDIAGPWLSHAIKSVPEATFYEISSISEAPAHLDGLSDRVMFLETIEHLPRGTESQALERISMLLQPNGTLILSTPAAGIAQLLDPAWYLVGHRHYRFRRLSELLDHAEMEIIDVRYWGGFRTMINIILMYFWKHILRRRYEPAGWMNRRFDSSLSIRRNLFSTNIWVFARRKCAV